MVEEPIYVFKIYADHDEELQAELRHIEDDEKGGPTFAIISVVMLSKGRFYVVCR